MVCVVPQTARKQSILSVHFTSLTFTVGIPLSFATYGQPNPAAREKKFIKKCLKKKKQRNKDKNFKKKLRKYEKLKKVMWTTKYAQKKTVIIRNKFKFISNFNNFIFQSIK
jgi:hypothetical protein